MAWFPADLIRLITAAIRDGSKLPLSLVSCGIFLIVSSLALIVSKRPGDVLRTWHGSAAAAAYTYYAVLIVTVAFGLVEVFFGFFVDLLRRRCWSLTAKVLLCVSVLPLAVVLAFLAGLKL